MRNSLVVRVEIEAEVQRLILHLSAGYCPE